MVQEPPRKELIDIMMKQLDEITKLEKEGRPVPEELRRSLILSIDARLIQNKKEQEGLLEGE